MTSRTVNVIIIPPSGRAGNSDCAVYDREGYNVLMVYV